MKTILLTTSFIIILTLSAHAEVPLKIKIIGISGELLTNVTTRLQAKQENITKATIPTFYQEAPKEIATALEPYGYFKSTITNHTLRHKKDHWEITMQVTPGPPVKITTIDLVISGPGTTDKKLQQQLQKFPLKSGDTFRTNSYNAAKQFLFDTAGVYGYINAALSHKEVKINLATNTATIILHFDTGSQYYFGPTIFTAPFFSKKFLAKFLPYQQGEIYSSDKINMLQEALNNSNFFNKTIVTPQVTKFKQVPIAVTLTPRKAKQYKVGAGYGTDTGFRGSLGIELRHLTPTGHSCKGLVQGSQVQNNLALHYLIPGKRPTTDLYDINTTVETLTLPHGKSTTIQTGLGYITVVQGWRQTVKLSLQHERYKLSQQSYQNSTLLIPSVNWLHSNSDDPTRPTKGHSININIQGANKYILATNSFLQSQIDAKYLQTFFTRMQLLLRTTLGFTAIDNINNLPLSLQFYTGGIHTIRGFGYNTIGPGRNLAIGSIELRHKIVADWYLATFFDAGNASNNLWQKPQQGLGIGIVLRTIIGTLELTFAKAISKPGTPGKIQFSLGAEL